jgi:ABC-type oligopeptide transport system ATPase subunit
MSAQPLLVAEGLKKYFPVREGLLIERTKDYVRAVDDVSFEINVGETLGLVGESGSGKSTTGYCVIRLLELTAGRIFFEGKEITRLKGESLRQIRMHRSTRG